jgi:FtsZ-interacting cell division protein ZipA
MSELQFSLIVIGVLVVAAVYAFNRWQERQLRRRVEERPLYRDRADDVATEEGRVEPRLGNADGSAAALPQGGDAPPPGLGHSLRTERSAGDDSTADTAIDYVADIEAGSAIGQELLNDFLHRAHAIGKPVAVEGWTADGRERMSLPLADARPVVRVRAALQLANRTGPANRVQLCTLRDLAQELAERTGGRCECPEIDAAAQAAAELDQFCAEVDISIGCNVLPNAGGGLPGTKVRGLLESSGYVLESDGNFRLRAEDGAALVSVADTQGMAFTAERMREATLDGLSLSMDVPKVPANGRVFERMFETARHLAQALDASVVDDNRAPLTDAGLKVIRNELHAVQAAMHMRGIPAGSRAALRLFS